MFKKFNLDKTEKLIVERVFRHRKKNPLKKMRGQMEHNVIRTGSHEPSGYAIETVFSTINASICLQKEEQRKTFFRT